MDIIEKKLKDIHPYKKNPRKNDNAVEYVANSIKEFGFKVPLVIDKEGEIVTGHTRYKAAKQLGLKKVPCIIAEDLTPEQIRAFRLADNKVAELAEWDLKLLDFELDALAEVDIDMSDFSFDVDSIHDDWTEQHEKNKKDERFADANILNLEKMQFYGVGEYDIPPLRPLKKVPEVEEWISFNYVLTETHPENKGVHFFINDYQFERIWNNPDKYMARLQEFAVVATPDFSPYGDMPFAAQLWNHYRKHWVGAYMQTFGIPVIPTIRASTDKRSKKFYLDGEPRGGAVLISSMWTSTEEDLEIFLEEYEQMKKTLKPSQILIYGKIPEQITDDVIRIPTFAETRWEKTAKK